MAAVALATAGFVYVVFVADPGFPDGHLTDYQRWALPLQTAAVGVLVALGFGFLALIADKQGAPRLFWAGVVLVLLVTLAVFFLLPAIGMQSLQLENGQGG